MRVMVKIIGTTAEYSPHTNLNFSFVVEVFMSWSVCIIFIEVLFMLRSSMSMSQPLLNAVEDVEGNMYDL